MAAVSQRVSNDTRNSVETNCYAKNPTLVHSETCFYWFKPLAKSLWPAKPVQSLAYYTGAQERTANNWVAGKVDPPSRALISLIQSDQGWRVLSHLMRNSKQHWWIETVKARELARSDEKDQLKLPL